MIKKRSLFRVFTILFVGIVLVLSSGCKDNVGARNTTYTLKVKDVLGILGTVTFTETNPTITTIDIKLTGAPVGSHPAQLCMNSVVDGGTVVLLLNPVDVNGKSSTVVTTMPYAQLIGYDGFIKVLKSDSEPNIILAEGDIGGNVLTTSSKSYALTTMASYGVAGNALFQKRQNGNTLVTLSMTGTIAGNLYPATINLGSVTSVGGGPVVATLANVDGTTGKSYTNIKTLDSGLAITYDNWMVYDGYINVYQMSGIQSIVISHGNIGSN